MTKRLKRSFLCFLCGSLILSATACKSHTDTGESSLFSDSRIEEMGSMDQQESVFNTEQTSSNAVSSEKINTNRPVANNSSQPRPEQEESGKNRPFVYLLFEFQSVYYGDQTQMNWNDMVRFYTSLQGRFNKRSKETNQYIYQFHDSTDSFWYDYLREDGKLLEDCEIESVDDWEGLWSHFGDFIKESGLVVWDPKVPATANVAATVCSVEGYLPVRYDPNPASLYSTLKMLDVPIRLDLCEKFDGVLGSKIADTDIPSSGSIKCDPYLWAMEKYFNRCNPSMLAYVLDGASQVEGNPIYETAESTSPEYNQPYSHDYYIYHSCFFFDLTCTADERPCDDPTQPMGTDFKTLTKILSAAEKKNNGEIFKLIGFPPWYMKYTTHLNRSSVEPVALEWNFTALLSSYNIAKEADAAHPAWMTNASVYCQYQPTIKKYQNSKVTVTETFDPKVRYFTVYLGDYDSSAWLKEMVPSCFKPEGRGKIPLMWAFNPNLSDRVPMIFDYIYENKTDLDFFITGDTGAGYVMPTFLKDTVPWLRYSKAYMEKFDMDMVGFIIDKRPLTNRELDLYAKLSPVGSFHNDSTRVLDIYQKQTVFMRMWDYYPTNAGWEESMYQWFNGNGTNFASFRSIRLTTDTATKSIEDFIAYANAKNDGYTYQYVDAYTLFHLVLQSGQGKQINP